MVTRKKRRALLISIITIFILILATVFALLYFTTDSFKSNQTLFIKYMGKTEENYNWIEETIKNIVMNEEQKSTPYEEKTTIKINHTKNIGTTSEDTSSNINKMQVTIDGKTDLQNKVDYKDIKLINDNNEIFNMKYMQDGDTYGIKFPELIKQYVTANNSEVGTLFKKIGYSEEETSKLPDSLKMEQSIFDGVQFSNEEKQALKDKYLGIVKQNVSKEKFLKEPNQQITINQQNLIANKYTIKLTKEELNNLYLKILTTLKEDETVLAKLETLQTNMETINILTKNKTNIKENFVSEIEETITKINENNIGSDETEISVYEKNGKTIKIFINGIDYEINIDTLENEYAQIAISNEENSKNYILEKKDGNVALILEGTKKDKTNKITLKQKENQIDETTNEKNTSIIYENETNKIEGSSAQKIKKITSVEKQEKFDDKNSVNLSELNEEQVKTIIQKVNEVVTQKLNAINEETGIKNDINNILEIMGVIKDNKKLEGDGASEAEKNRFNSKFEILQGEKLNTDTTLKMIDTIKNNLIGMEVVNGREIRLNIDKNNSNEETVSKLQAFMEENKDYNYDAKTEYDDNGFVKSILLTINVER